MNILISIYRILLLGCFSVITFAATEAEKQMPADPMSKAMTVSYQEKVAPLSVEKQMIKTYFEQKVFPLVPQAIKNLQANAICPGPCCPEQKVDGFNQPDKHAAIIAYQLMGKRVCPIENWPK